MSAVSEFGREIMQRLCREGFPDGQSVELVNFVENSSTGRGVNNFTSTLQTFQIVVKIDGIEQVHDLYLKRLVTDVGFVKKVATQGRFYHKEIGMYTSILPYIKKFQTDRGMKDTISPCFPRHYISSDDDGKSYIVLEDLKIKGYHVADKYAGLSYEQCRLTLCKVAQFHATSYAIGLTFPEKKLGELFPGLLDESMWDGPNQTDLKGVWYLVYYAVVDMVKRYDPLLASKMSKFKRRTPTVIAEPYVRADDPVRVICLGDLWVNNIMFRYNGPDPVEVKFLDFQLTRTVSLAVDLCYFLFTSTLTEFRRKNLDDLLGAYLNSFKSSLHDLGVTDTDHLTLDYLMQLMRKELPSQLIHMSFAIALQWWDNTRMDYVVPDDVFPVKFSESEALEAGACVEDMPEVVAEVIKCMYDPRVRDRLIEFYSEMDEWGAFD